MASKLRNALLLLLPLALHVAAQSGTVAVGPLLTCSITTFACAGVNGCCTIGGCCGSGCCPNGYTCINGGSACCPVTDATKCGTVSVRMPWTIGQPSCQGTCPNCCC